LSLVIGGAKSGKTALAEGFVRGTGLGMSVIVTAEIWDAEMQAKVDAHRAARGPGWHVIEAPQDLPAAIGRLQPGSAVLVDCITLWLSNRLLAEADLTVEVDALLAALDQTPGPIVVVTNEVGLSIVPENALARRFRDEQGRINQRLARQADVVMGVMAGLPFPLKGALPPGFAL
jgi:adenosylcobinamide kinase / adenosylcobinamide-phosphate guanylyltransferase